MEKGLGFANGTLSSQLSGGMRNKKKYYRRRFD